MDREYQYNVDVVDILFDLAAGRVILTARNGNRYVFTLSSLFHKALQRTDLATHGTFEVV